MGKSGDRPAAEKDEQGGRRLTQVRITAPEKPGEPARVVVAAREGLARDVLVGRALPLLARARRMADHQADLQAYTPISRETWEKLADDIADLIGHSVTDQPRAPELEAVLRDGEPARLTWEQLETLPGTLVAELPREALPLEPAVPAVPAEPEPCPMAPYAESREPAAPVDEDPGARARRLDAERDEAGRVYRAAIYAADEAHRAIGGR